MKNCRRVSYKGKTYLIPDAWLMGYTQDGTSITNAIEYWHTQATLEHEWYAQHMEDK